MAPIEPLPEFRIEKFKTVPMNTEAVDIPDSDSDCDFHAVVTDENDVETRLSKKPKTEHQVVAKDVLPVGFLDPLTPEERLALSRSKSAPKNCRSVRNHDGNQKAVVNYEKPIVAAVPSSCKQFWKAGDYEEVSANNADSVSLRDGMDHLRVHPRFLHSNATSHKWALGAFAELLDNALDEVCNGATYVHVDMLDNKKDTNKMLLVEDNGGGMTPDKMRQCMSLGYSAKSKLANTIGQYGNGFKTSTMRLGADVIVFTRCLGTDGSSPTQSIGMLSYTFLRKTGKEDIVVPMIDFEKRGEDWRMLVRSSPVDWKRNMETVVQWSPYSSEEDLLQQFNFLNDQGTRIIIYNLWEDDEGQLELDFDTDPHDIQIRGVNRDPKKIEMAKDYPNSRHFLTYRHSFRSYAAILYLKIPAGFRIILRGKDVEHHNIVDDMMLTKEAVYRPARASGDMIRKDQNMVAVVTIGFVKDAKDHIDVQGFNVYHKNRLIKPFWRVWNAAGSDGRGVIGVLEADFVEPAHDKQGFERTTVLQRLEHKLLSMQKTYWSSNCHKIGYAKRRKTVSETECSPSGREKSDEHVVPNGIDTNDAQVNPTRKRKCVERKVAEDAEMPEVYSQTPRKSNHMASTPFKESKVTPRRVHMEVGTLNGDGCISPDKNGGTVIDVRKDNHELMHRFERNDGMMVNDLLRELQFERDRNASLEKQVQKAKEKIEELDKEQEALINIFSEERERRDQEEDTLRRKLKEALGSLEELQQRIKLLESRPVMSCKLEY